MQEVEGLHMMLHTMLHMMLHSDPTAAANVLQLTAPEGLCMQSSKCLGPQAAPQVNALFHIAGVNDTRLALL
jgi:hypothetical protein